MKKIIYLGIVSILIFVIASCGAQDFGNSVLYLDGVAFEKYEGHSDVFLPVDYKEAYSIYYKKQEVASNNETWTINLEVDGSCIGSEDNAGIAKLSVTGQSEMISEILGIDAKRYDQYFSLEKTFYNPTKVDSQAILIGVYIPCKVRGEFIFVPVYFDLLYTDNKVVEDVFSDEYISLDEFINDSKVFPY